ncbi:MAG: hypothetical protein WAN11_27760 [Syntrophobacteraceae bacterium]
MGDSYFDVLHSSGHSSDSICFHRTQDGIPCIGDTPLKVLTPNGASLSECVTALERIARLCVEIIYSGHDKPVRTKAGQMIGNTLANVLKVTSPEKRWKAEV